MTNAEIRMTNEFQSTNLNEDDAGCARLAENLQPATFNLQLSLPPGD